MGTMRSIDVGKEKIEFEVAFAPRKTLEISVHPGGMVTVRAPNGSPWEKIEDKVRRRARWIWKQQRYFQQFEPRTPARRYVGGETHLYLGRRYRLKVVQGIQQSVKIMGGFIQVSTHYPGRNEMTQQLVEGWYLERAHVKFAERLNHCFPFFAERGYTEPPIIIRQLSKRWGSLSPGGRMTLNRELIRAPAECIDYVITHELCHLEHKGHHQEFFDLLSRAMPGWEKRKQHLELALI
ncbi:MAG: M48 family metallopeptidase [Magnetococcales bacterium]|nr:M48 family metallopeptidase [Magnetococcales bacterium]